MNIVGTRGMKMQEELGEIKGRLNRVTINQTKA